MSEASRPNLSDKLICFLCHQIQQEQKYQSPEWETTWLRKCSESLCHLLDIDGLSVPFFESGYYCPECLNLIREVDFTVRTVTSLQNRLSKVRTKIAEFLIAGLNDIPDGISAPCDNVSNQTSSLLLSPKQENSDISDDIDGSHALGSVSMVFDPDLCQAELQDHEFNLYDIRVCTNKMDWNRNSYLLENDNNLLSSPYSRPSADNRPKLMDLTSWDNTPKKFVLGRESLPPRNSKSPRGQKNIDPGEVPEISGSQLAGNVDQRRTAINHGQNFPTIKALLSLSSSLPPATTDQENDGNDGAESCFSNPVQIHPALCSIENLANSSAAPNPAQDALSNRVETLHRLRAHLGRQRGKSLYTKLFECNVCQIRCDSDTTLRRHLQRDHAKMGPHNCDVKNCVAGRTNSLDDTRGRYREIDDQNKFYFTQPDQDVMSSYATQRVNTKKPRRAKGKVSFLSKHLEINDKFPRPFRCTLCGKRFARRPNYSRHACKKNERRHQCEYCGKGFTSLHYLSIHRRMVHHAEFRFKCSLCCRNYGRQKDVERHKKLHTNISGFNCVLRGCSSPNFRTMQELRAHVTGPMHDATRRYLACEICGHESNGINAKELMNAHLRIHTGEKPIRCRYCDEVFRIYSARSNHEKKRHVGTHRQHV